jgi:hypothetical protein
VSLLDVHARTIDLFADNTLDVHIVSDVGQGAVLHAVPATINQYSTFLPTLNDTAVLLLTDCRDGRA